MKKTLIVLMLVLSLVMPLAVTQAQGPGEGGPVVEGNFSGSVNIGSFNPLRSNDTAAGRIADDLLFPDVIGASPFTQYYARVGEEGVYGGLATDWTVSEDGLTYTVTLRQDAVWSDGTPITALDVKFSFEAIASGAADTPLTGYINYVEDGNPTGISEVTIIDDYTVEFKFETAACTALGLIGYDVAPAHVFGYDGSPEFDFSIMVDHPMDTDPEVVFGPFEVARFASGEAIGLSPVESWPEGVVIPSGYVYRDVPDQTVEVEQFLAGELNFMDGPSVARRDDLRADANTVVADFPGNAWDFMAFNLADPDNPQPAVDENGDPIDQGHHPIFGDVRVRRALQYAVDVEGILEAAVFGEGTQMAANTIPTSWAADPNLAPIPYDPVKAGEMLDEAGWPLGDNGVRTCQGCMYAEEGTPFAFELITNQGNTRREAIGVIIQDQLYELGIDVDFQAIDFQTLIDTTYGAQTFDAFILGWREGFPSDPDQLQLFSTSSDDPANQGSNASSYNNPEMIDLMIKANTVPGCDPQARAEIYYEIQKMMQEDPPYIWLFAQNLMYAARVEVEGFAAEPNLPLWNVHAWQIAQ
ncbi:MAG: hypothetical protein JXQ72_11605 [Anaerolineae bacterium]|nr:hypothetical protein [Anaerolineae bacterium]